MMIPKVKNCITSVKVTDLIPPNVVYIITNEYTKSKRTYTIGKTVDLVKRLGTYNKLQDAQANTK